MNTRSMTVGGNFSVDAGSINHVNNKITLSVVITCIVAASSGLIFGYDIGISGGVTTMAPFLRKFFPSVSKKARGGTRTNIYCIYDSLALTAFTSSLYIAGMVTSLIASRLTLIIGRKNIMVLGGFTFLVGACVNGGAVNLVMLIIGRILLGFGVGFTVQAAPLYLSEVAPPKWRGAFNTGFQFFLGIGVVISACINYMTSRLNWGWRFSLGFAVVPAALMTFGSLLISDTPSSLVERGKLAQAKQSLLRARGINSDIEAELADLVKSSEIAKAANREPFITIFERQYRPHLVMTFVIPIFHQLSGINIISFYAPVLFRSVGLGNDSALIAAIILGVCHLSSIAVSAFLVDRFGRRLLFMVGGIQMCLSEVAVASVLAATTGSGTRQISEGYAILVLVLMCTYVVGYGLSWGPLSWLISSEIYPLKIRTTSQSINVAIYYGVTFLVAQFFLTMLCHFKFGAFLFYAGWIAVMTIFVALFLPETKGIPLDSMHAVWERHWFWRRFVIPGQLQGHSH
ncbi:hypothetical protein FEM48_Zijuj06G0115000 [Ziziphus jujuba var. spinosa]|uniref:Major facilitator superfamily (MFS) profile domain-containing protein n=1 Tax=Ziziphus jujuba var. spinosa TaxID=714518 RepID=A0A978V913_ZIZJJ|nr:hypothetical protein FEM48_Zijuj06G0115000 [Ziziphus jujuba var. spinosa]